MTVLPPAQAVDISIDKDRVYNTITVTFTGGQGQVLVKDILVMGDYLRWHRRTKNIPIGDPCLNRVIS